ncbi:MAG TPA: phosphoglycerate kinase [Lentisphaeria bacterium]|nr:MAG: phosphoglycerate kinase [Lentisphaerae bacterium GWF2_38_69]HBM16616.1 phosphoglycerate kinase [Lentisphaeria bacterium]
MGLNKKTIRDIDLKGKKVVMRVDFNVPIKEGKIKDDTRIVAALDSIKYIIEKGASLVLLSHLGRPDGEKKVEYSMKPVAEKLQELLGKKVIFADDCIGEAVVKQANALKSGEVMLCENTRFYKQEDMKAKTDEDKKLQDDFVKELAKLGNVYVNDAFGTAHRAHASTALICKYVRPSVAGFLMEKEIEYLGNAVSNPQHPFVAIIGGAKVSGKLEVLKSLMEKVNTIIIGGGMAYTFLKAQGHTIGASLVEEDLIATALDTLKTAKEKGVKFMLPIDNVIADKFDNAAAIKTVGLEVPDNWMALDIGPKTVALYTEEIKNAKTIVWNGPMGCFEMSNFANGTMSICRAVAESGAISVIGGGDSVSAVNQSGLASKMTHVSTGGGASLEFLEGKSLPGVTALDDK